MTQWLDGGFGDPLPIARGRKEPEALRAKPEEAERFHAIWTDARQLIEEERFLNWQIAFPGVWQNWASAGREGGFDAVIGNPPWDRFEFEEVPWFEARDASIALAPSGAKRKAAIKAMRSSDTPLAKQYEHATKRMSMATKVAKGKAIYSTLNKGKLNIYKLFVERSHALVQPKGMVGLLTPSGIAADLSSAKFFRQLSTHGHIKSLYDFENRRTRYGLGPFFPDVDTRFKFAAMTASPGRVFEATVCGFFLQAAKENEDPETAFPITPGDFARVNPNTGTAPIFRTRKDMELTTAVYAQVPVLHEDGVDPASQPWSVGYSQTINMTSDSHLFRNRDELEDEVGAWPIGGNRYQSADGKWVPLYEGKMVQAFNHRAANIIVNPQNVNRPAQPLPAEIHELQDPDWLADPQYWVQPKTDLVQSEYTLGFKDVTAPTNVRTMIASMIPTGAAGNTFPLLLLDDGVAEPATDQVLLLGNLNSFALDYIARQKVQGQHLNWYIVEQLPVIPPNAYARTFGPKTAAEIVREAVLELTYTAHDMAAFARDMGHVDADGEVLPPFAWDEDRRLQLRAKLDALYFILYGIYDPDDVGQSREDIRYIYSTFPIVERQEVAEWGSYRSRDLALAWINALMAGQPDAEVTG